MTALAFAPQGADLLTLSNRIDERFGNIIDRNGYSNFIPYHKVNPDDTHWLKAHFFGLL